MADRKAVPQANFKQIQLFSWLERRSWRCFCCFLGHDDCDFWWLSVVNLAGIYSDSPPRSWIICFDCLGNFPNWPPKKINLITSVEVDDQNSPSQIRAFGVFPCLDFRIAPFYVTKLQTSSSRHKNVASHIWNPVLPSISSWKNVNFG